MLDMGISRRCAENKETKQVDIFGNINEKELERKLAAEVKSAGGWSIKLLATHVTGLPDRLCLLPGGRAIFVEVKSTGEKPRKIQIHIHKKIRALGFRVEVIDKLEQIQDIL